MKSFKDFFRKDRRPTPAQLEALEQENARLRSRIAELEKQNVLLKEGKRIAEDKFKEAPYIVAGIHQLDPAGFKAIFGNQIDCYVEDGAAILRNVSPYLNAGEAKVELVFPPGVHFELLSQIVGVLCPQSYDDLSNLLDTYDDELASADFLPCIWEGIKDEEGNVITWRLTLAPPEKASFACICGSQISELKLSSDEYLERITKHLGKELSEAQQEETRNFFTSVLKNVCGKWHEMFPGVIFPEQPSDCEE